MATLTDAVGRLAVPPTLQITPAPTKKTQTDAEAVFLERKDLKTGKKEYSREGSNPGLVLVFNQERFEATDVSPRIGTRRDVNEIATCFGRLGLNIGCDNIHTDYTRQEIFNTIDKIVNSDLSQVNCLIVFFLSHGDSLNNLHASDGTVKCNEIWGRFASCRQLVGKPKMFIFQACKGDKHSTVPVQPIPIVGEEKREHDLIDVTNTFASNYLSPDMLVVYSATQDNLSFRNPVTGTWFIQELCKIFSAYGRRDDVVSLVIRTTKCVAGNYSYYDQERNQIQKQMPLFVSTLRKKFYLNRSKDRHIILHILEEQERMWQVIRELERKTTALTQAKNK